MSTNTTGESWRKSTVIPPWTAWTSQQVHGLANLPSAPSSNVPPVNSVWLPGRDPSWRTSSKATPSVVPIAVPLRPSTTYVRPVRTSRRVFGLKRLRIAPDAFRRSYRASQARRLSFRTRTNFRSSQSLSTPERRVLPWAAPKKHSIGVQVHEVVASTCDAQTQIDAASSSNLYELSRLRGENRSLRSHCDSLSHSFAVVRDEVTQLRERKQILAVSPHVLKTKISEQHAACTTKDAKITAISDELRDCNEQKAELEKQVKDQEAALAFASCQLTSLKSDQDKLTEENRSLRQQIAEVSDELLKQSDVVDKKAQQVADVLATVDQLRAKNEAMESEMSKVKHEMEDKCAQLRATFDTDKQALEEEIQQLEASREAQAQQVESLAKEREDHQKEIAVLRKDLTATFDTEKRALEEKLMQQKSSNDADSKQIESMSKEREVHENEIAGLREELTDLTVASNKDKRALEQKLLQQTSSNEADSRQIESLSKERDDHKKKLERLREENEALRNDMRLKNGDEVCAAENSEEPSRPMTRNARKRQAQALVNEGSPGCASDGSPALAKRTRPTTRSTARAIKESVDCAECTSKDAQLSKYKQLLKNASARLKTRKHEAESPEEHSRQNESGGESASSRLALDRDAENEPHIELEPPTVMHLGKLLRHFEPEEVASNARLRGTEEEEIVLPLELIYTGSVRRLTVTGNDGSVAEMVVDVMPGSPEGCRYTFSHFSYPQVLDRDMVFTLKYAQHPTLRREGNDLVHKEVVPLLQALLGARIRVALFTGEVVSLDFDRPIQHGEKHRFEGRGFPILNDPGGKVKRGDLIIEFNVEFPDALSDEAREQINQALSE